MGGAARPAFVFQNPKMWRAAPPPRLFRSPFTKNPTKKQPQKLLEVV